MSEITAATTTTANTETCIQLALHEYRLTKDNGGKLATIARQHQVSKVTLYQHLNGTQSQQSINHSNQKLTPSQEKGLKEHILEMESQHRSYDITTLISKAEQLFLEHSFNQKWVSRFCECHRLNKRWDNGSDKYHVFAVTKESVMEYYQVLQKAFNLYQIQPHNLYNMDETCVWMGGSRSQCKIIGQLTQSEKSPSQLSASTRQTCTGIETICADGSSIPSTIILAGVLPRLNYLNGAEDTLLLMTPKGYNTKVNMMKWAQHFNEHTSSKLSDREWRLLILDGATVHLGYDFLSYCKENRICIFTFPAHHTHILQPLDQVVFSPLKRCYNQLCHLQLRDATPGKKKQMLATLWNHAKRSVVTSDLIKKVFSSVGIHPFNSTVINLFRLGHHQERTLTPPLLPAFNLRELISAGSEREKLFQHIQQLETSTNTITNSIQALEYVFTCVDTMKANLHDLQPQLDPETTSPLSTQ